MRLLDGMIMSRRFSSFIREFIQLYNEDVEEKNLWEYWLHKCFDKSYADFKKSLHTEEKTTKAPTQAEITKALTTSYTMLSGFDPYGGANHGDIQAAGDNRNRQ